MKLNCIIDTCSCIYLSNTEYRQKSLLKYLNDKASLNYSGEVHLELRDHSDKNLPVFIQNNKLRIIPNKFSINDYEKRMLGSTLVSRKKKENKGEVDNFLISVDQIHYFKKNSVIFITDDEKAINGVLNNWLDSFPVIKVWTSYEVILFLYAESIIPSKDIALELIKYIINFTAPETNLRSPETTTKFINILNKYNKRIENISKLLN